MSVTSGFFNSKNHDRRYNALQMGSIFDGVIYDGVYMDIGTRFETLANGTDRMITVGVGRAWFNHTWIYNDAPLPLEVPEAELILKRIDAVVLDIDNTLPVRKNDIIVVKGVPSSNPVRPTLLNETNHHQYAVSYIEVAAGATSIRQANVTNVVGQDPTPFVTGPLKSMDITEIVKKWNDQWDAFYSQETSDMLQTADQWKATWQEWFDLFTSSNNADIVAWKQENEEEFNEWFNSLQVILEGDVATNLTAQVVKLNSEMAFMKQFREDLMRDRAIYDPLLDSDGNPILDSDSDEIIASVKFQAAGICECLER